MLINIIFLLIIAISALRTAVYGIYAIKNDGISAGLSVFILCGGVLFSGYVIIASEILQ